jgi:chemotaxis protein histidine kinase CheA
MNQKLQQEFLSETIDSLTNLQQDLRNSETETLSEDFLRHFFRRIHSVKGTAQTFGFNNLSRTAHEVENLLQAITWNKLFQNEETSLLLEESLTHLLELSRDDLHSIPSEFTERLKQLIPAQNQQTDRNYLDEKIPKSLSSKLSEQESEKLKSAFEDGKIFYLIEVFFQLSEFSNGFVNFRSVLAHHGEIIAVSPSEKTGAGEIGFQLFFVSAKAFAEIKETIAKYKAEINFESETTNNSSNDLDGLISNLVSDCKKKARILGKKSVFEISNQIHNTDRKNLILINYLLLHLLRNAIDHAIETPNERLAAQKSPEGKIKLDIYERDSNLIIRLEDDGRGIDAQKVAAQARKRGVIHADQILTKDETINLIFAHGFSTAEIVSDISGRGVGLDVVRDLVENAGGTITVQTETDRGTIFEIALPR